MKKRSVLLALPLFFGLMVLISLLQWSAQEPISHALHNKVTLTDGEEKEVCMGDNLLFNPSFEGEYAAYIYPEPGNDDCGGTTCERAQMPEGWQPRWLPDGTREFLIMPEYTQSTPDQVNPDRVRSGGKSMHYFSFFTMHESAVFQQVTTTVGGEYCFSAWGHAWSNRQDGNSTDGFLSAELDSIDDGLLYQRVGVDPTGGTDWQADTVVWSDERRQYDYFGLFAVTATAQAEQMTVFVYSRADFPVKHNDVYWDDARLTLNQFGSAEVTGTPLIQMTEPITESTLLTTTVVLSLSEGITWTASLDPMGTITPSLVTVSDTLYIAVDIGGLMTGTYTSSVTINTSQVLPNFPIEIPIHIIVVDQVYGAYLPVIMKP